MDCITVTKLVLGLVLVGFSPAGAHEWHRHSDESESSAPAGWHLVRSGETPARSGVVTQTGGQEQNDGSTRDGQPDIARHFARFKNVKTRWDDANLFIESNGLPDHNMMVGIRSWQQQVPLPQPYTGRNAWQIPLRPRLSDQPISARTNLFRGAIAIAVNGVPIFNALNNRGEDAYLAGELDQWGGHCGRGDDYHYHMAPVHLEQIVGKGNPIAFALDGYPIYGLTEADGSPVGKLDEFNGQFDEQGRYHYHATKKYPYINGGLRGVVTVRGGQVEPQPRDSPIRPAFEPLRGATITAFIRTQQKSELTYTLRGSTGTVTWEPSGETAFRFTYKQPGGSLWTETYQRAANRDRPDGRRPPPRRRPRRDR